MALPLTRVCFLRRPPVRPPFRSAIVVDGADVATAGGGGGGDAGSDKGGGGGGSSGQSGESSRSTLGGGGGTQTAGGIGATYCSAHSDGKAQQGGSTIYFKDAATYGCGDGRTGPQWCGGGGGGYYGGGSCGVVQGCVHFSDRRLPPLPPPPPPPAMNWTNNRVIRQVDLEYM